MNSLKALQPMHPKIIKLNEDIAAQEKLIDVPRREFTRQLINRRQVLQLEVKNMEKVFNEWEGKALEASRKMDYLTDRLRQDVQRTQVVYRQAAFGDFNGGRGQVCGPGELFQLGIGAGLRGGPGQ